MAQDVSQSSGRVACNRPMAPVAPGRDAEAQPGADVEQTQPTARVPASPFVSGMQPLAPIKGQLMTAAAPAPLASFRSDSNTLGGTRRVRVTSSPAVVGSTSTRFTSLANTAMHPQQQELPLPQQQQQERKTSLQLTRPSPSGLLGMNGSFAIRGENPRFIDFRASALQAQLSQAAAAAPPARSQRNSAVRSCSAREG